MRRLAAALAGVALLAVAGCGGGSDAHKILQQTGTSLGTIRSGTLEMKLLVTPSGGGDPFGFRLHGPFRLASKSDALPRTKMKYTQIANGKQATVELVSNGTDAYVESDGQRIPLSPAQADALSKAGGQLKGSKGTGLPIASWVKDGKVTDGGTVAGVETDKVTADLDVVAVVNGLLQVVQLTGRDVGTVKDADAKQLQDGVKASSFELWSGKQDHVLRRLRMMVDFGFDVPADLRSALGDLVGAKVDFELGVAKPKT